MASYLASENRQSQVLDQGNRLISSIMNQSKTVGNMIKTTAHSAGAKWKEGSTVTKAWIIGSATAIVAPLSIIPVLGAVGFTSAGVAAGSLAASMQTATTVSGSVFALCQSAGAVGAVATSAFMAVGLAAGATAGSVTAAICGKTGHSQTNEGDGQDEVEKEKQDDVEVERRGGRTA